MVYFDNSHSAANSLKLLLGDMRGAPRIHNAVKCKYLPRVRRNNHVTVLNVSTGYLIPIYQMDNRRRRPMTYIKVVEDDALGKVTVRKLIPVTDDGGLR